MWLRFCGLPENNCTWDVFHVASSWFKCQYIFILFWYEHRPAWFYIQICLENLAAVILQKLESKATLGKLTLLMLLNNNMCLYPVGGLLRKDRGPFFNFLWFGPLFRSWVLSWVWPQLLLQANGNPFQTSKRPPKHHLKFENGYNVQL